MVSFGTLRFGCWPIALGKFLEAKNLKNAKLEEILKVIPKKCQFFSGIIIMLNTYWLSKVMNKSLKLLKK